MKVNFLKRFNSFIEENKLFQKEDKILLTVSGGVDSMVLVNLFAESGYSFGIAHCNFGLRAEESEGDEAFVKALAEELQVQYYIRNFNTKAFASENNISTQMAARELRYQWFEEVRAANGFRYIATAHHKDDVAETILLNLIKGTVLKGLHGILPKTKNHIIRPMLWAEKEEILEFSGAEKIGYREDSSNIENKYQRNLIRNQVIPLLKQVNPDAVNTMYQNAQHRLKLENWLDKQTDSLFNVLFIPEKANFKCEIAELEKSGINEAVLFQMLETFGFSYSQVKSLFTALNETEHKRFTSDTHRLLKERNEIIILPIYPNEKKPEKMETFVNEDGKSAEIAGRKFALVKIEHEEIDDLKNPMVAYLDIEKLTFPLQIRNWQAGDYFYPMGMKGKKKLSDYFTDIKASVLEKEQQLVLASKGEIIWIVGKRTDSRFGISQDTKKILKISIA